MQRRILPQPTACCAPCSTASPAMPMRPSISAMRCADSADARAATCLRLAADLRPGFADALNNLGNATRNREFDSAMGAFEEALRVQPDHLAALNNAAVCCAPLDESTRRKTCCAATCNRSLPSSALRQSRQRTQGCRRTQRAIACFRTRSSSIRPIRPRTAIWLRALLPIANTGTVRAECERWSADSQRRAAPRGGRAPGPLRGPTLERRLRIRRFSDHCQTLFTLPLLSSTTMAAFAYAAIRASNAPMRIPNALRRTPIRGETCERSMTRRSAA